MACHYGDALLELLYDIDAEVRITNLTKEVVEIHNIDPKKYLVVPGTDRRILDNSGKYGSWREKRIVKPPKGDSIYPTYEIRKMKECEVGDIITITLIQRIAHVEPELIKKNIPRVDTSNFIRFHPGELEERIASHKKNLKERLKNFGLAPDASKFYFELVGTANRFD